MSANSTTTLKKKRSPPAVSSPPALKLPNIATVTQQQPKSVVGALSKRLEKKRDASSIVYQRQMLPTVIGISERQHQLTKRIPVPAPVIVPVPVLVPVATAEQVPEVELNEDVSIR